MATEAQIKANRRNAKKCTGPRTPQGKAIASQNSIKHGLRATRDVIKSESQEEFDHHRRRFFAELAPSSAIEYALAERIISLAWRLKRACSIHNLTIDALQEDHCEIQRLLGKKNQLHPGQPDLTLGHIAVKDFANTRALDGLIMYERRIESSFYKTLFEFGRRQSKRKEENPNSVDEQTEHLLMSAR
ncbi:MAG: hypothetical protein JSV99_02185 [Planctomycetota bacterium]|nr:MAG: hypothetical protein JSV99_02185 [Planctomycetota bacterium]